MRFHPGPLAATSLCPLAGRPGLRLSDVLETSAGRPVLFANCHDVDQEGQDGTSATGGLAASRTGVRLPQLRLEARRSPRAPVQSAPTPEWRRSLAGEPGAAFDLLCAADDEHDARSLLTSDIVTLLADHAADCDVEMVDDWVFLSSPHDVVTLDPQRWQSVTTAMAALLGRVDVWGRRTA